jgi:F-type H+-transporting ATPase subunit delta
MTSRAVASRYAKALFEVVLKDGDVHAVERELAAFVDLMAGHRELHDALTSPAVPVQKKQAVVATLIERAGVAPMIARTLSLLASRDRLSLLPDLLAEYRQRLLDRDGVLRAEITTATPVEAGRMQQIEHGLATATGKRITMESHVDPSIVGGLVARVGGTVYDGSVVMQLKKIKDALAQG